MQPKQELNHTEHETRTKSNSNSGDHLILHTDMSQLVRICLKKKKRKPLPILIYIKSNTKVNTDNMWV